MTQYMISVWHEDEYELDFSGVDAQRQLAQVSSFNADLVDAGVWVSLRACIPDLPPS